MFLQPCTKIPSKYHQLPESGPDEQDWTKLNEWFNLLELALNCTSNVLHDKILYSRIQIIQKILFIFKDASNTIRLKYTKAKEKLYQLLTKRININAYE